MDFVHAGARVPAHAKVVRSLLNLWFAFVAEPGGEPLGLPGWGKRGLGDSGMDGEQDVGGICVALQLGCGRYVSVRSELSSLRLL